MDEYWIDRYRNFHSAAISKLLFSSVPCFRWPDLGWYCSILVLSTSCLIPVSFFPTFCLVPSRHTPYLLSRSSGQMHHLPTHTTSTILLQLRSSRSYVKNRNVPAPSISHLIRSDLGSLFCGFWFMICGSLGVVTALVVERTAWS